MAEDFERYKKCMDEWQHGQIELNRKNEERFKRLEEEVFKK